MSSNTLSLYISFEKAITSKRNRCHYATRVVASLRILANMHPFSGDRNGDQGGTSPFLTVCVPYSVGATILSASDVIFLVAPAYRLGAKVLVRPSPAARQDP